MNMAKNGNITKKMIKSKTSDGRESQRRCRQVKFLGMNVITMLTKPKR